MRNHASTFCFSTFTLLPTFRTFFFADEEIIQDGGDPFLCFFNYFSPPPLYFPLFNFFFFKNDYPPSDCGTSREEGEGLRVGHVVTPGRGGVVCGKSRASSSSLISK